jgi:hypothetical protein
MAYGLLNPIIRNAVKEKLMFAKFNDKINAHVSKQLPKLVPDCFTLNDHGEEITAVDSEGKCFILECSRNWNQPARGFLCASDFYNLYDDIPTFGDLGEDRFPKMFTSLNEDDDAYYRGVDFWDGVKTTPEYWKHVKVQDYNKDAIILGVCKEHDYDYGALKDENKFIVVQDSIVTEYDPVDFFKFMEAESEGVY